MKRLVGLRNGADMENDQILGRLLFYLLWWLNKASSSLPWKEVEEERISAASMPNST